MSRNISAGTMSALDDDRIVSARIILRDVLMRFDDQSASEAFTGTARMHRTGGQLPSDVLRVVLIDNAVWVQDGTLASRGSWTNTGITVKDGSGVSVGQTYLYYQNTSGNACYRVWGGSSFGGETVDNPTGWDTSCTAAFAAIADYGRFYYMERYYEAYSNMDVYLGKIGYKTNGGSTFAYDGTHYDSYSNIDGFFAATTTNQRGNSVYFIFLGTDGAKNSIYYKWEASNWGKMEKILPLDIIDDTSKFILGGVKTYFSKIFITGRLVRTSGADLQIYALFYDGDTDNGPAMTLGREMFIFEHNEPAIEDLGVDLWFDDTNHYIYALGLNNIWRAQQTYWWDPDNFDPSALKTTITGTENWSMSCGHNNVTSLQIQINPADDHALLEEGSLLDLEIAYNSNYSLLGRFIIDAVDRTRAERGQDIIVRASDEVGWRLEMAHLDADWDFWGPAKQNAFAKDYAQFLRSPAGTWSDYGTDGLVNTEMTPRISATLSMVPCYLTTLAHPGEGGMVRALFDHVDEATDLVKPDIGVMLNFYNEQKYEAEERGASGWGSYGMEAFVAAYGEKANFGNKGIGLYKCMPSETLPDGSNREYQTWSRQYLGGVDVDLDGQQFWIMMIVRDSYIRVYTKRIGVTDWTLRVEHTYDYQYAYPYYEMKKRGRAGVLFSNPAEHFSTQPFGPDSLYIPANSFSGGTWNGGSVPTTDNIIVDHEIITYNGKDTNNNSSAGVTPTIEFYPEGYTVPDDLIDHDNPYTGPFTGYEIYCKGEFPYATDHNWYDDMVLYVYSGPGKGQVYKITDLDYLAPNQWIDTGGPYTWPDTWDKHIGDLAYGSWDTTNKYHRWFVNEEPSRSLGVGTMFGVAHRLDVDTRGVSDTLVTSHDSVYGFIHRDVTTVVKNVQYHSSEKPLTFKSVSKQIARKAGVMNMEYEQKYDIGSLTSLSATGWNVSSHHSSHWQDGAEAVIDMYLNNITSSRIGIGLLPETLDASSTGYLCVIDSTYVYLYTYGPSSAITLVEQLAHEANVATGSYLTFVAQNDFISVYVSDALIAGFPVTMSEGVTLLSYNNASAYIDWSELDIYVENYICDMGSSAWSMLGRLIGEKHINFQHDEGTLKFFRNRSTLSGNWDFAIEGTDQDQHDPIVTRLRMEGVDVYEYTDFTLLKQFGNIFRTANSEEINDAEELKIEAKYIVDDSNSARNRVSLVGAADPRVEPDDILNVTFTGSDRTDTRDVIIENLAFTMTVGIDNATFDMIVEGKDV